MYINTETMEYPVDTQEIIDRYPNTSFPTPFVAPEPYADVLYTTPPEYDPMTQGLRQLEPEYRDPNWYVVWEVYALSAEQIAANEAEAKQKNKDKATELLKESDWTCTIDINNPQYSNPYLGNQPAWLAYRSAVRQIAVNPPVTVGDWPSIPAEVWVDVPAA